MEEIMQAETARRPPQPPQQPPQTDQEIREELFAAVMQRKWGNVVGLFQTCPKTRTMKITQSDHTALHLAVFYSEESIVASMVSAVEKNEDRAEARSALAAKNKNGYTPLHLAASIGSIEMCRVIVRADKKLAAGAAANDKMQLVTEITNMNGETPLFEAVNYGQSAVFDYLEDEQSKMRKKSEEERKKSEEELKKIEEESKKIEEKIEEESKKIEEKIEEESKKIEEETAMCRRSLDGQTILHCAILGEYFGLAYKIMQKHKWLVNSKTEEGQSPLHILATKISAFKSGSTLGRWESLIYKWMYVDVDVNYSNENNFNNNKIIIKNHPQNYTVCVGFIELFLKAVRVVTNLDCTRRAYDPELPTDQHERRYPVNYATCIHFAKLIWKSLLVVLGSGYTKIKKLKELKEKHMWANLVLKELVEMGKMYDFEEPGGKPAGEQLDPFLAIAPNESNDMHPPAPPGHAKISKLQELEDKHVWANQVLERLIETAKSYDDNKPVSNPKTGGEQLNDFMVVATTENSSMLLLPHDIKFPVSSSNQEKKTETAVLVAAQNGIVEIVEKILERYPVAIVDRNTDNKNVLLLTVEKRRLGVYKLLLKNNKTLLERMFRKVDNKGDTALHFAAALGSDHLPWPIPGAALQMQWEIKWFKYIASSMPSRIFLRTNKEGKTPQEVFTSSHKDLVQSGGAWLTNTSTSCSVVAALIATVAFAASTTIPGGVDQGSGRPTLKNQPAFEIFAVASLVALCFSVTSLVMFLAILTSRYQEKDFETDLPRKLLLGLTSLFLSIAAMLCAFCAGHFFVLEDKLKTAAFPVYIITSLPVTLFAAVQFPLYLDLVTATFSTPF